MDIATLRRLNSVHEQTGAYWAIGTIMPLTIRSKTRGITSRNQAHTKVRFPGGMVILVAEYMGIVTPFEIYFSKKFGASDFLEFL